MLRLRKRTPALIVGEYTPLLEESEDCFAFLRTNGGFEAQICLVVLNMSNRSHKLNFDLNTQRSKLLFSNCAREADSDNIAQLSVAPFEIYIGELA
jgi:alpha-glucosidase